jgi:hypothetical protein
MSVLDGAAVMAENGDHSLLAAVKKRVAFANVCYRGKFRFDVISSV